ncbi:hypothetical protein BG003_009391 [Podila horticola]|nr:hypothetical protein BG003_009391 [Podila horticola]
MGGGGVMVSGRTCGKRGMIVEEPEMEQKKNVSTLPSSCQESTVKGTDDLALPKYLAKDHDDASLLKLLAKDDDNASLLKYSAKDHDDSIL